MIICAVKKTLGIQSYSQMMIGVSNHFLSIVFRFHYHSQEVIGSLGIKKKPEKNTILSTSKGSRVGIYPNYPFARMLDPSSPSQGDMAYSFRDSRKSQLQTPTHLSHEVSRILSARRPDPTARNLSHIEAFDVEFYNCGG